MMRISNKLSTDFSVVARVVGNEAEIHEMLSTIKGVKSVTSLGKNEENTTDFLIEPEEGEDVRGAIFERIVSRKKQLLALSSNKLSLEQIFLKITESDSADEIRELLSKKEEN